MQILPLFFLLAKVFGDQSNPLDGLPRCSLFFVGKGTFTAQGKLMFTIFSGMSQFERDLIQMRTKEGLEAARARGRKGGRPKVNQKNIDLALNLYDSKSCSIADILKTTGISKATLYSYLKRR